MSEELALSIVTSWPSTKTELLSFLRKQSPDLGPFVCRDAAAIIEHLDSSLAAAEARVAALTQENAELRERETWLRAQLDRLKRWAAEQNAGNAFAHQLVHAVGSTLRDVDLPAEKREP